MDNNMCFHFLSLFLMQCLMVMLIVNGSNLTTDQFALVSFKAHILDPRSVLSSNWSTTSLVCNWIGISCSARYGRVSVLDLSNKGLNGTIHPQLGDLSFLVSLNLSGNNFHGNLPEELLNLRRLKLIDLSYNTFTGEIPSWFGALENAEILALSNNNFIGTIPKTLSNMSNLVTLDLGNNLIQGNIPYEIGDLQKLKIFRVPFNHIFGTIPSSIFNLSSLQELSLSYNTLSGSLPDDLCSYVPELEALILSSTVGVSGFIPSRIGECSKLQVFSLFGNQVNGIIPTSIGNLTRLRGIYLGENNLEGEIPSEIGNLRFLETFIANNMRLNGSIPVSISNISSLQTVYLYNNSLSGSLPSMSLLSNLETFVVWGNYLSGNIPESISNASKLRILSLNLNSLSGFIPDTLGNLSLLEELRLWSNNLTTKSPNHEWKFLSSLANCKNLTLVEISSNPLNGILPTSISNFSSLEEFQASDCQIKGSIPLEIGSLSNIIFLNLAQNELSGSIPTTIGSLKNLQALYLDDNKLKDAIPYNICGLESLNALQVSVNMLQGPIPTCFGDLTSLRSLYLESNKLDSSIPITFWGLKDILRVDLSSNYLNGSLPLDIGNLKVLTYLNLSWNLLSSDIPATIGALNALQVLSLSNNRLQGQIPESLGDLISLETLDLSNNNLSGIIPMSLERLSYLRHFNVVFNQLEGQIPTSGNFQNFTVESFMNNYALCGPPRLKVPPCSNSDRPSNTTPIHVLRYVLPVVAALIVIVTFIILFKKCQNRSTYLSVNESNLTSEIVNRNLYNRLVQVTNGFSDGNLLGSGSFGSVYKGMLSDGKNVAIKVFNLQLEGTFKSFDVECEIMQSILHRNLVKVISCCSCVDFKALVLEFMPNGSLERWLYSEYHFLNMVQRINIMLDVASALEYLHLGHPNPIIHCDLKPSNILLDEDMVAHVGDFGIAKLLGDAESVKHTMTLATIGYMAPEYGSSGIVSIKSDIYSYGILLMETFTGKKPTDEMFVGGNSMKQWVKESLPNGTIGIVDSSLFQTNEEQIMPTMNCVLSIMRLALDCSVDLPEERKDMKDVVSTLTNIKTKLLKDIRLA